MRGLVGFRKGRDARARLTEVSDGFSMRLIANDGFRLNQGFQIAVRINMDKNTQQSDALYRVTHHVRQNLLLTFI